MKATFISFGYNSDSRTPKADEFLDVRTIRNPWGNPELRRLTGRDAAVQDYIRDDPQTRYIKGLARLVLKDGVRIAFGCFGGKHRSVALAEMLAQELRNEGWTVDVLHTQLDRDLVQA